MFGAHPVNILDIRLANFLEGISAQDKELFTISAIASVANDCP